LVDEAQDTNRAQWQVVETLAAEFFAGEGASEKVRTMFAVGDAKQSIFSFQRADPKEFIAARNRIFASAQGADLPTAAVPLNLSFRSGEAVLSLVDAVFDAESRAVIGLSPDAEAVQHDFTRKGQAGLVELWPLEAPEDKSSENTPDWALPLVQESVSDAQQRTAWRIARRISKMLLTDEMLTSKGRPIQAGDILILVRRRTPFVDHLVRALKSLGVPVAGRDRMVLTEELAVMDLLMLARFALQPTDDLSLATVLKGPFVGFDDATLFDLAHARKGSLWQALLRRKSAGAFAGVAHMLKRLLDCVDVKTPFEFFNYMLTEMGGRKKLVAQLGVEIHDPVDELLEEALSFELTTSASMQAFVHSVEHSSLQIKRDMEAAGNNVRIMTVHGAKGLEAPIVFLSDLVSLPNSTPETRLLPIPSLVANKPPIPLWTSPANGLALVEGIKDTIKAKQLAEYRRLLYVALTRAQDRLYVAGWQAKGVPSEDSWASAIEMGFDQLETVEVTLPGGIAGRRFEVDQTAKLMADAAKPAQISRIPAPPWLFDAMPEEPTPARPLAPSRPDEEPAVSSPLERTDSKRFQRGRYIHALLEWLPEVATDKRQVAARRYLAKSAAYLTDAQQQAVWQEVDIILTSPRFAPLFGPNSRAEVPIAGLVAGRAITGQVDRLVVTEAEVLIVDYKTNRPPPTDVSGVAGVYLRQMGLYVRALGNIYPEKTVRAALLWTDAANLMELPKPLMDEALSKLGL
jgi:ATP-dependent helicase/nuclease subunit A